ncbi:glycosyltransferase family 2 protein [Aromatoleum aromaticum]|uniref:Glycosyltransferase, possibly involved in succinoglycan biosynthesis protein n=1 Tax=Aromatoleum aromaticum (strain DSM 19018 / LMG 30748 / EbN1) TaxID=76114 RepID=Q5P298_AROAE|nr:glycosyltransferase family A protein [Aromatoleum aromaticum]NMG56208.1 glycosyltransferase [Aromatoleum aromaticum]CAI08566.1 putative glycosyltransferase, possibly involved in succinoglycan biosynthesis protein [Aromatoleum aromaticum EbN1]
MFGVVIPYFQRRSGVLARTLQSVAQQDVDVPVCVVVVDDASPASAEEEVGNVCFPNNFSVRIIRQENAGPGAARNAGIDALADVAYIAFLDSDDCWEPYHLSSALHAFEHGFDYYTAETMDGASGYRMHANHFRGMLPLRSHPSAPWAQELMQPLIDFTVCGPISGSSTFVVTKSLIGDTRFRCELRTAGEDGLFTTELAAKSPRVMISRRTDTVLGKGVNIFSDGDWGSGASTLRAIYFLRSRLMMRPLVQPFPVALDKVDALIRHARKEVWKSGLANLRRGGFPLRAFVEAVRMDPPLLGVGPAIFADVIRRK